MSRQRLWLTSYDQIVDYSYGEEFALDVDGETSIHFNQTESDSHIFTVHDQNGEYVCTIDDRDPIREIRMTIENAVWGTVPKVTATKTIMMSGTSMTVNVTKEVRQLGLTRGDVVNVTLTRTDAKEDDS